MLGRILVEKREDDDRDECIGHSYKVHVFSSTEDCTGSMSESWELEEKKEGEERW